MIATLTFTLPEEREEHDLAINGWKYKAALTALDERLRQWIKYGTGSDSGKVEFAPELARQWLWDELANQGIQDIC